MASFENANYICSCYSKKCDRNCRTYRRFTHTESNADGIRSSSDEKLAELFAHLTDCVNCPCRDPHDQCNTVDGSCQKQWLDWLKKEN